MVPRDMKIMGETSVHRTLFVRSISAVAVMIALSGCDPQSGSDEAAPQAAPRATSAAPVAEASSGGPALDAATVEACGELKKDLKDNDKQVAKALKIGPPAGHIAVSAQWIAGAAAIGEHSEGANETVRAAAQKVREEMRSLSDEYNESAKAKPSKEKFEAAVEELDAACSAA